MKIETSETAAEFIIVVTTPHYKCRLTVPKTPQQPAQQSAKASAR